MPGPRFSGSPCRPGHFAPKTAPGGLHQPDFRGPGLDAFFPPRISPPGALEHLLSTVASSACHVFVTAIHIPLFLKPLVPADLPPCWAAGFATVLVGAVQWGPPPPCALPAGPALGAGFPRAWYL